LYKYLIKIIFINIVISFLMTTCAAINSNFENSFLSGKLNSINLVEQPDGNLCGVERI